MSPSEVLARFDGIRRAQRAGQYAPHKPLLLLLALARLQQGLPRLSTFGEVDEPLKQLLTEFAPSSAPQSRHYPFWHLGTDRGGQLWEIERPAAWAQRAAASTPTMGEWRDTQARAGLAADVVQALQATPALIPQVAQHILSASFPVSLHADIAAEVGLNLDVEPIALQVSEATGPGYATPPMRRRDSTFRERVLRAYEWRCCVCGFDLRIGHLNAGLEAAHIQWHNTGGPDIEPNGLSLCALHHKLFDLGAFTIEPSEHRVLFSQHAISAERGLTGVLQHHGQPIHAPQNAAAKPGSAYLAWNLKNVFKAPHRAHPN